MKQLAQAIQLSIVRLVIFYGQVIKSIKQRVLLLQKNVFINQKIKITQELNKTVTQNQHNQNVC